jgi:protein-disulfide isomerase
MEPQHDEQLTTSPTEAPAATPVAAKQSFLIPVSILAGFGMVALAIFFSGGGLGSTPTAIDLNAAQQGGAAAPERGEVRPIDDTDHVRGNPNAPIVLVEYSDYDCPFCKQYHETMNRIINEYGPDGKVAWVYRHFPLEQLHPNAVKVAEAAECVAALAGNDAFWTFSDLVFEERDTNEPTNMTRLSEYAVTAGADETAFNNCLANGDYADKVAEDMVDGRNAGAEGTPHTLVMVGGQETTISGAQPYGVVKQFIDNVLSQVEGGN